MFFRVRTDWVTQKILTCITQNWYCYTGIVNSTDDEDEDDLSDDYDGFYEHREKSVPSEYPEQVVVHHFHVCAFVFIFPPAFCLSTTQLTSGSLPISDWFFLFTAYLWLVLFIHCVSLIGSLYSPLTFEWRSQNGCCAHFSIRFV